MSDITMVDANGRVTHVTMAEMMARKSTRMWMDVITDAKPYDRRRMKRIMRLVGENS